MSELLPVFVKLQGRRVVVVGGGAVAASKLASLQAAEADIRVVAPDVHPDIERSGVPVDRRRFVPSDLDGAWLAVAAATPDVNREVAAAAEARQIFVNAVDDPANASAFLSGVVRRDGVTLAISTSGDAPGLTALLRQALDAVLPEDLSRWLDEARSQRAVWRQKRVPMAERRPLLLQALNRLYNSDPANEGSAPDVEPASDEDAAPVGSRRGHVSIVGAGPGDPGLLTRRAVARLRTADLVLYDALVDRRVLAIARRAQRFFVGKRAGRHALSQADIHAAMIRAARRGRRVVRLKGGDPFVFGRGGEEAIALIEAGIPFDVVPGVTSVAAAPALAGIPVTHRGLSSALLVVSGHDEDAFRNVAAHIGSRGLTLVILMGLARRSSLASILVESGWNRSLPAAIVAEASTPRQQVWRGTLGALAADEAAIEGDGPATIVVGEVASLELGGGQEREQVQGAACQVPGSVQGSGFQVRP